MNAVDETENEKVNDKLQRLQSFIYWVELSKTDNVEWRVKASLSQWKLKCLQSSTIMFMR